MSSAINLRLTEIKTRAEDVLNGFKRPSNRLAVDIIFLLEALGQAQRRILADELRRAGGKTREAKASDMPNFLKGLFK